MAKKSRSTRKALKSKKQGIVMNTPVNQIVEEPVAEEAVETVEEAVAEEAVETVEEPVVEEAVETVEEPVVEEAVETVEEPVVEEAVEAVEEAVAEEAVETVEEPVAEEASEPQKTLDFYFIVQYFGNEVNLAEVLSQVKAAAGEFSKLDVYVKVEDKSAYYVTDKTNGRIDLWRGARASMEKYDLDAPYHKNVYFQFRGKEVSIEKIVENVNNAIQKSAVLDASLNNMEKLELYAKLDDETVYYLIDNSIDKKVGMFS